MNLKPPSGGFLGIFRMDIREETQ